MSRRIRGHYLIGSYARKTAVYPLDDVDIIFVIDPAAWTTDPRFFPAPLSVLTSFAKAIRYRYTSSSVYLQRRSVGLELFHMRIDVVPAILNERDDESVWVGDRYENHWILS